MEYKYCVFVGRFQPFHSAHYSIIKHGLTLAERLILVVGSTNSSRTVKNPWTFQERVLMIESALKPEELKRIDFVPSRDYYYNENQWLCEIQQKVAQLTDYESNSICITGAHKDSSSYYIDCFKQLGWTFEPAEPHDFLNATDIRKDILYPEGSGLDDQWFKRTPCADWLKKNFIDTDTYLSLREEAKYLVEYKKKNDNGQFPRTYVTADAVVIQSGHILVVKRKFNPGKGLYALPGGFVKQNETIERAALRELKEETGIKTDTRNLKIDSSRVFDHPDRSLRGRTITHAFCIVLPTGELPELRASDDASGAMWMPLADVALLENEFFEDHAHIIRHFINRY